MVIPKVLSQKTLLKYLKIDINSTLTDSSMTHCSIMNKNIKDKPKIKDTTKSTIFFYLQSYFVLHAMENI